MSKLYIDLIKLSENHDSIINFINLNFQRMKDAIEFWANNLVTTPEESSLLVEETGGGQVLAANAWTTVDFNTTILDTDLAWESANNKWVCPSNGRWLLTAGVSVTSQGDWMLALRDVITQNNYAQNRSNSTDRLNVSMVLDLVATDEIEVVTWCVSSARTVQGSGGNAYSTRFSAIKLAGD